MLLVSSILRDSIHLVYSWLNMIKLFLCFFLC